MYGFGQFWELYGKLFFGSSSFSYGRRGWL